MTKAAEVGATEAVFTLLRQVKPNSVRDSFFESDVDSELPEAEAMRAIDALNLQSKERPLFDVQILRCKAEVFCGHLDGLMGDFRRVKTGWNRLKLLGC